MKSAGHSIWYFPGNDGCHFMLIRTPVVALNTLLNPINLIKTEGLGF
jgi:hypothetical protein